MKKMILVTSPPACGKPYISKQLAKNLKHVVYLDKDTLIVLSNRIFDVAGEERNRSSDFFESNIRNYEYEAIINIAMEALDYDDIVLINAPFSRDIRYPGYVSVPEAAGNEERPPGDHLGRHGPRDLPSAHDTPQLQPGHMEAGKLG